MKGAIVAAAVAALASTAVAEPRVPSPREIRDTRPRHLRMRPRAAQVAPTQPTRMATPMPRAPSVSATSPAQLTALDGVRDVNQPVSITVNVGYQIDGSRPSGRSALGAPAPMPGADYAELRSYGFGEAFVSTRGIGWRPLQTYFALRFQAARALSTDVGDDPLAPPIATWFDRSGQELRTGWGEIRDFLPARWGLSKLRVRAGDQYIYGPWMMHLTGVNAAYESQLVSVALYGGRRRADYARSLEDNQPGAFGASLRFDLRGLTDRVPIVASGDFLHLNASGTLDQRATDTSRLQLDWRPRRDVAVIGQMRWLDGDAANRRIEVRTRFREVTNLVLEVVQRFEDDWRWDPTLVEHSAITEARRYLDLGPVLPQVQMSARGGTLIAENVDLFARVAGAIDATRELEPTSTYNASYFEAAGGLEVRLRRQLAFGATVLTRDTKRADPVAPIVDQRTAAQPLPDPDLLGEEGFVEVGTTFRLTLGARRFSGLLELYGRRTRFVPIYEDPLLPVATADVRGGGRVSFDAWLGRRARVSVSYDASSALDTAPEITGYKSLRLVMTGVY